MVVHFNAWTRETEGRPPLSEKLPSISGLCSPRWYLGGGFQYHSYLGENLGCSGMTSSMRDFDGLIRDCRLQDVLLSNAQFTRSKSEEG